MPRHIDFTSSNGQTTIEALHWPCDTEPRGVVQLCHGMCEHVGRYDEFARFLNSQGFAVVGNSHLGHGASLIEGRYGYFGEDGAYNLLVEDLELMRRKAAALYPGLPYFLFGHSMGSFIARLYVARYGERLTAAVICGTSGPNPLSSIGQLLTKLVIALRGRTYVCHWLEKLAGMDNLKRIPDARTPSDWLSRDTAKVDEFIADERCGFTFTCSAYLELARMLDNVSHEAWFHAVPRDLPLLLISGEEDPVGHWGAGVLEVYERLREAGVSDVELKLYPGARHELLNETNREEVFGDVARFLNKHIAQAVK